MFNIVHDQIVFCIISIVFSCFFFKFFLVNFSIDFFFVGIFFIFLSLQKHFILQVVLVVVCWLLSKYLWNKMFLWHSIFVNFFSILHSFCQIFLQNLWYCYDKAKMFFNKLNEKFNLKRKRNT